jgi:hypothetical protein
VTGTLAEQQLYSDTGEHTIFQQAVVAEKLLHGEGNLLDVRFQREVFGECRRTLEITLWSMTGTRSCDLGEGYLKVGFGGAHTESNHRLMYTSAWASPQ